jgi:hypothetical protein
MVALTIYIIMSLRRFQARDRGIMSLPQPSGSSLGAPLRSTPREDPQGLGRDVIPLIPPPHNSDLLQTMPTPHFCMGEKESLIKPCKMVHFDHFWIYKSSKMPKTCFVHPYRPFVRRGKSRPPPPPPTHVHVLTYG